MSGKGPGAGFDFQARAIAFVGAHMLARRALNWTEASDGDVPIAVRAEGGTTADDIRIELQSASTVYECQAKRGLSADARLDEAIELFANGLPEHNEELGIILVDDSSAGTVRVNLRDDLTLLRQGARNAPAGALKRVLATLQAKGADAIASRLHVVVLDIEEASAPHAQVAQLILAGVLDDPDQAAAAWGSLVADALSLCRTGGRRDYSGLVAVLSQQNIATIGSARGSAAEHRVIRSDIADLKAMLSTLVTPPQVLSGQVDEFTESLEEAKRLLDDGFADAALARLCALSVSGEKSEAATRLRYENLTAVALLRLGQPEAAREHLSTALEIDSKNLIALKNLAQAELLLDNQRAAMDAANRVLEAEPTSPVAWSVIVQIDVDRLVPDEVSDDPHVLTGIGLAALRAERWDDAVTALERALKQSYDSERAIMLAFALEGRIIEGGAQVQPTDVNRASELLDSALTSLGPKGDSKLVERALIARGQLARVRGDEAAALEDFSAALSTSPKSVAAISLVASAYIDQGRAEEALRVVDRAGAVIDESTLRGVRARALIELGRREEALEAIRAAEISPSDLARGWRDQLMLVELALDAGSPELASDQLSRVDSAPKWLTALMEARIAVARDDESAAQAAFVRAASWATDVNRRRILAEHAEWERRSGNPKRAVELLEEANAADNRVFWPTYARALSEGREFVKAAAFLDRVRKEDSELPQWALLLGANVAMVSDDVGAAIDYLGQLVARDGRNIGARIRLAHSYLRARETSQAVAVLDELRSMGSVAPRQMLYMAELYIRAGSPREALPLAYRALRAAPDAPDVAVAYVNIFLRREDEEELDAPVVAPNTYVKLRTSRGDEMEYFIVANESPRPGSIEVPPNAPLARELIGKRIGEQITIRPGALTQTIAEIVEIKSHFVYAFQDTLLRFPTRHPESSVLQMFKVPEEPAAEDLEFLTESLRSRAQTATQLLDLYLEQGGLPLGLIASAMGAKLPDAYWSIAADRTHPLLVEFGDSLQQSVAAAVSERAAILTRSALLTLQFLQAFDVAARVRPRLIVPRSLIDELLDERADLVEKARLGQKMVYQDADGLVAHETSSQQWSAELARFDELMRWIDAHCEIHTRPLAAAQKENEEHRERMGASSYDTIELAAADDSEVFADDLGLRRIHLTGTGRFGFSTYGLLLSARGNVLEEEAFQRHVAGLIRLSHAAVSLEPETLVIALSDASYAVNARIVPLLDRIRDPQISDPNVAAFIVKALVRLALRRDGRRHLGSVAYALADAGVEGRDGAKMLALITRYAGIAMRLLPEEHDEVLAALDRFTRFKMRGEPPLFS